MAMQDRVQDDKSSAVRTPEGDNEEVPGEVLEPGTETDGMQPWPTIDTNKV